MLDARRIRGFKSFKIVLTVFGDSGRRAFYSWNRGKLISGAGSELASLRLGSFQPQPLLSNEKEIRIAVCVLQTPRLTWRSALFRGDDGCPVCAWQSLSATSHAPSGQANPPTGGFAAANKIAPEVLADTADGRSASVIILLADQADVNAGYGMRDQDAQGWFVYNTLTQHAARTQIGLKNFLSSRGVTYQSFWVVNMLVATADRALVEALAARPDVARVDSNRPTRWIEDPSIANFGVTPSDPSVVEWGVQNVNAPQVWAMGFTGQGIVIGNQDTGMRWTHNALKPHYRGWNGATADHNYNWHDSIHSGGGSCWPNNLAPCDDQGHGTHTTGTTSGDDGSGQPGWSGSRGEVDRLPQYGRWASARPATYTECFQFFIAPDRPERPESQSRSAPHVMNNSWGCPVSEGCTTLAELETIVNNTQAAGIFVEVSAGNAGPGCSSVNDPPAIYEASFSTGAIDISNTLAGFSSRGPSTFYTPNLLKPNISAPGVNVRSSTRTQRQ